VLKDLFILIGLASDATYGSHSGRAPEKGQAASYRRLLARGMVEVNGNRYRISAAGQRAVERMLREMEGDN
jgi:hypothetical protein